MVDPAALLDATRRLAADRTRQARYAATSPARRPSRDRRAGTPTCSFVAEDQSGASGDLGCR